MNPIRPNRITRRRFLGLAGGVAALGAGGMGEFNERHAFEVRRATVAIPNLPDPLVGLRIAHLSDWHFRPGNFYRRVVEASNAEHPDLVAMTGDLVEARPDVAPLAECVRELRAPLGIYAVPGNHDEWCEAEGLLETALGRAGGWLMRNAMGRAVHRGAAFTIGGVDYREPRMWHCQREREEGFHLQLVHLPVQFHFPDNSAPLTLAGHTHGGQIRFPGWVPHLPYGSAGYCDGLYREADSHRSLYVSRGLGTFLLPVRFGCPPEIAVLTLARG